MNTLKSFRTVLNTTFFSELNTKSILSKKGWILKNLKTNGNMRTNQPIWVVGLTAEFLPITEDLQWGQQVIAWEAAEKFNSVLVGIALCCTGYWGNDYSKGTFWENQWGSSRQQSPRKK